MSLAHTMPMPACVYVRTYAHRTHARTAHTARTDCMHCTHCTHCMHVRARIHTDYDNIYPDTSVQSMIPYVLLTNTIIITNVLL